MMLRHAFQDLPPVEQDIWRDAEEEFGVNGQEWGPSDLGVPADLLRDAVEQIDAIEETGSGQYLVVESRWENP